MPFNSGFGKYTHILFNSKLYNCTNLYLLVKYIARKVIINHVNKQNVQFKWGLTINIRNRTRISFVNLACILKYWDWCVLSVNYSMSILICFIVRVSGERQRINSDKLINIFCGCWSKIYITFSFQQLSTVYLELINILVTAFEAFSLSSLRTFLFIIINEKKNRDNLAFNQSLDLRYNTIKSFFSFSHWTIIYRNTSIICKYIVWRS